MERDINETQQQQASLCRSGCGFYGNASTDGMCSKCYKDSIRRKQSSPTTPAVQCSSSTPSGPGPNTSDESNSPKCEQTPEIGSTSGITGASTVGIESTDRQPEAGSSSSQDDNPSDSTTDPSRAKKKNRCGTCNKKVGLTGFSCRCGGLFCGLHRYSDKHSCQYDYKAEGRAEITKNNPVIVGSKIQKI